MTILRSTSDPNSEKQSIAKKASSCLQAFADLLEKLQTQAEAGGSSCKDAQQNKNDGISLNAVKNEFDRFRDWCSHKGADKEGPGSLDDGLQLAANTYRVVLNLLNNLDELLCEVSRCRRYLVYQRWTTAIMGTRRAWAPKFQLGETYGKLT
ncbi:Secondary metabolism regulator LAE1 [Fusarium oxysporum f. sp. albedinis]|nr:Secondary metabolism regulator LAE1 [Fusarium oxysporum f. sp. albedinis]